MKLFHTSILRGSRIMKCDEDPKRYTAKTIAVNAIGGIVSFNPTMTFGNFNLVMIMKMR